MSLPRPAEGTPPTERGTAHAHPGVGTYADGVHQAWGVNHEHEHAGPHDHLDLAWADAEDALPPGWELSLEYDGMTYSAEAREDGLPRSVIGLWRAANAPTAALRQIAALLRESV